MLRPTQRQIAKERRAFIEEEFRREVVELSERNVRDDELKWIEKKVVKYVKRLELNQNFITAIGISILSPLKWSALTKIELMSNKIGNKGCLYLSKMVSSPLQSIFLNNNHIDSSGALHLSKGKWSVLQMIVLYYNRIGGDGIYCLLKSNWICLGNLHLSWNDLQDYQKVPLVLGEWKKIKAINLQTDEVAHDSPALLNCLKKKFPRVNFNTTVLIRHMTA